jgi:hypothetical protein
VDGANPLDRTNWSNTYLSYYTHGHALGLGFDLAIREHTGQARSLDDFMRAMWRTHGRPGGSPPGYVDAPYTLDDVRARLAEVTGDRAFGDALVSRYTSRARADGLRAASRAGGPRPARAPSRRAVVRSDEPPADGRRLRLSSQPPLGSPLYSRASVGRRDHEPQRSGGRRLRRARSRALAARARHGRVAALRAPRERQEQTATVTLIEDPTLELVPLEKIGGTLSEAQRAFRQRWIGAR